MSERFEELGSRSGFRPEPDGLDKKCIVCGAKPGEFCRNPITGEPRRGGVSCIGRKERSPVSSIQTDRSGGSTGLSDGNTGASQRGEGMTVALDHRCNVRIWKLRTFELVAQQRTEEGQRPIDVVKVLLRQSELCEAIATADWDDGSRWSGFVYRTGRHGVEVIHHDEIQRLVEWPEFDNRGPSGFVGKEGDQQQ